VTVFDDFTINQLAQRDEQIAALKRQRDDLLEALKGLLASLPIGHGFGTHNDSCPICRAQAIIAKVEGQP